MGRRQKGRIKWFVSMYAQESGLDGRLTFLIEAGVRPGGTLMLHYKGYSGCVELDERTPDRPFSGRFMLRLPPELHRDVFVRARREGKSLNQWISEKLERAMRMD